MLKSYIMEGDYLKAPKFNIDDEALHLGGGKVNPTTTKFRFRQIEKL